MTRLVILITALWAALASAATADDPVVVELFTSQGCSSCPPADALLAQLADRDDVIALALHIDYWDYIGWKDSFADPAFTERQRAYARAAGQRSVYTPEMVVGGRDHIIGTKAMKLVESLERHKTARRPVDVSLSKAGSSVKIEARSTSTSGPVDILAAIVIPKATVDITRGENAGRRLTYHNIVRDLVRVGTWNGEGSYSATVPLPDGAKVAIIVQKPNAGPIVGAAQIR